MSTLTGTALLHEVAKRILAEYLRERGERDVIIGRSVLESAEAVDLTYSAGVGRSTSVKVKADPYYGNDPEKIARRDLPYYRAETSSCGFETMADTFTRQPGWMQRSVADELFYYFVAIGQPEEEVAALMDEPDRIFFSELHVERDDLRVLPMSALRAWFEVAGERFTPRPVVSEGRSAWYRIIPVAEVEKGVVGMRSIGRVFASLSPV